MLLHEEKITKEVVVSMGFLYYNFSVNPYYYKLSFSGKLDIECFFISEDINGKWYLNKMAGDTMARCKELETIYDLILELNKHCYEEGKVEIQEKMKETLGI